MNSRATAIGQLGGLHPVIGATVKGILIVIEYQNSHTIVTCRGWGRLNSERHMILPSDYIFSTHEIVKIVKK